MFVLTFVMVEDEAREQFKYMIFVEKFNTRSFVHMKI